MESQTKGLELGCIAKIRLILQQSSIMCTKERREMIYNIQKIWELNQKSLMEKYTMKDVYECIDDSGRADFTIFTTLDLTSGFWQMSLHSDSVLTNAPTLPGFVQCKWLMSSTLYLDIL
jgi:hypothetical protein